MIREDFRTDSDIDVLARYSRESPTHFRWEEAEAELKEIFGRKTDLINRNAVEQTRNYIRRSLTLYADDRYTKDQARLFDVMWFAEEILKSRKAMDLPELRKHPQLWNYEAYLTRRLYRMTSVVTVDTRKQLPELDWQRLDSLTTVVSEDGDVLNQSELEAFVREVCPSLIEVIEAFLPKHPELTKLVVDDYIVYCAPQIPAGLRQP